jgi:hypothetical protein
MDQPYCDHGCGQLAVIQCEEVGLCDDCLEVAAREALAPLLGKRCCTLVKQQANGEMAICIAQYGTEHCH